MKTEEQIYEIIENKLRDPLEELWDLLTQEERAIARRLIPEIAETLF